MFGVCERAGTAIDEHATPLKYFSSNKAISIQSLDRWHNAGDSNKLHHSQTINDKGM